MDHHSVVIENKKVYAVDDDEDQSFPTEWFLTEWRRGTNQEDSVPGNRNDWCAIGNLLYCIDTSGRILWCEPDELDWKEVKGLKKRQNPFPAIPNFPLRSTIRRVRRAETIKLCSNSAGNIVIFSKMLLGGPKNSRLCSEEISLERREGGEIWGKIEWFGTVFQLDPLSLASSFNVLFSASVHAYYGGGGTPNPVFPPPSPHPYMWSAQHHMMSLYGTPVPYPAMYPPGAVYAHPSMPMPPSFGPTNKETAKDQASGKKSKRNLKRKGEGGEKAPSGSGNDGVSQRCDL
ncbi:unnamed protein product [Arabis nemorensis]|uniref:Uncharacterized protein n=1 Tax=Arabis nemorensis TaxID=586526 RepID=A0A565C8N7_9BRAS|nr:unnamed protein product [Arabis nemorensis]